jgi:hypothetical protein
MIVIFVDERGVKQVTFRADNGPLDDAAMYLWPTVRRELRRLDGAVKREAARLAEKLVG